MCDPRRKRIDVPRLAAGLVVLACAGAPAWGQPLSRDIDSIEWMAADSSLVVRGAIVDLSTEEERDRGTWYRVTFRVDETLKGPHHPTLGFVLQRSRSDDETIERWHERGRMLLAFLDESRYLVALDSPKYARYPFAPRTGRREDSLVELNPAGEPQVFSMAPQALARQEEIVRAAKDALAAPPAPGRPCSHRLTLPNDLVRRTPWARYPLSGGTVFLTVPVDSRLEARAREWVLSRDQAMRREGAAALIYFKSGDNEAILKRLLDDRGTRDHATWEGGRIAHEGRVHRVRDAAYSILDAWGCMTRRPARGGGALLKNGTATFSQAINEGPSTPAQAVDGDFGDRNGWSIARADAFGGTKCETAVWETAADLAAGNLTFAMHFAHFNPGHLLGRFRFSVTTDDRSTFADGLHTGGDVDADWIVLTDPIVTGPTGMSFTTLADQSILVGGMTAGQGVYTVTYSTAVRGITGVRLEALEHPTLPGGEGPGLFPRNGDFQLTELSLDARVAAVPESTHPPRGSVSGLQPLPAQR